MLRAARNGQSAGAQPLNDRTASAQGLGEGTVYSHGTTMGIKDYKNVNTGLWRKSTDDEVNTWNLPAGAEMHPVITSNGKRTQKILKNPSSFLQAKIRLWDDALDSGSRTPFYVVTRASKPQKVISVNMETTDNADGSTTYSLSVGAGSGYAKSTCATSGIPDCGSGSARFVITPNGANSVKVEAYKDTSGYAGTYYWGGYTGGVTIDYRVSTPPSGGDVTGSVTVTPYTKEVTAKEVLQEASYTAETAVDQLYDYYTHATGSAEKETKTVLAQSASVATQNFAFDGMEDFDMDEIFREMEE